MFDNHRFFLRSSNERHCAHLYSSTSFIYGTLGPLDTNSTSRILQHLRIYARIIPPKRGQVQPTGDAPSIATNAPSSWTKFPKVWKGWMHASKLKKPWHDYRMVWLLVAPIFCNSSRIRGFHQTGDGTFCNHPLHAGSGSESVAGSQVLKAWTRFPCALAKAHKLLPLNAILISWPTSQRRRILGRLFIQPARRCVDFSMPDTHPVLNADGILSTLVLSFNHVCVWLHKPFPLRRETLPSWIFVIGLTELSRLHLKQQQFPA